MRVVSLIVTALALASSTAAQTVFYVDADAPGGDGISWATAFATLQDALAVASPGDEIWVAEGTYYPDEGAGQTDGDRASTFSLELAVEVYGGFDGTETTRGQRDIAANRVTLSGDLSQDDLPFDPETDSDSDPLTPSQTDHLVGDNALHVVSTGGADAASRLDGVRITAGSADSAPPNDASFGGGIFNAGGSPTLENLTIEGNRATRFGSGAKGGGLYTRDGSPLVTRTRILHNSTNYYGGGALAEGTGLPRFEEVEIHGNEAGAGGGGLMFFNGDGELARSTVSDNEALNFGGGVWIVSQDVLVQNVTISGNRAASAGGMWIQASSPTLNSLTVVGNEATSTTGGGIRVSSSATPTVSNSIVYGNTAGQGTIAQAQVFNESPPFDQTTIQFSILEGGLSPGSEDGGNNLDVDPQFGPLADNGGFAPTHLPGGVSPAIDAGTCAGLTTDQRNRVRPFDDPNSGNASDGCDPGAVEVGSDEIGGRLTHYVDAEAPGGDGTTWATAFSTLQDALAVTQPSDEIWVAEGTYYPDEGAGQTNGDRSSTYRLQSAVSVYGGFDGTETSRNQRDPAAHPVVLSGDLSQDDLPFEPEFDSDGDISTPTQTDHLVGANAYHVVTGDGADPAALLDGVTITAGLADGSGTGEDRGAGVYVSGGAPTLANLLVQGNRASVAGGGVSLGQSSSTLHSSTIAYNSASQGGGVFAFQGAPSLENVTLSGNRATSGGGLANNGSSPVLRGVTIALNEGGGISNQFDSDPVLVSSIVAGNVRTSGTVAEAQIRNASPGTDAPLVRFSAVEGGLSPGTQSGGDNLFEDPRLSALANHGGPTPTHRPNGLSIVVDAGTCEGLASDQRGQTRPYDDPDTSNASDGCDMGAVELQSNEVGRTVLLVDADATGAGTGTSWADAFPTLQDALAVAQPTDEIWMAEGTYYPDEGAGQTGDNPTSTFVLRSGVAIYGGFSGTETARDQRDITAHVVLLSGDLEQDDLPFDPDVDSDGIPQTPTQIDHHRGTNAFNVVRAASLSSSTRLDGISITGARSPGAGGGLLVSGNGSPVFFNLVLYGNSASDRGGAVHVGIASPSFTAVTLSGNFALEGGGLSVVEATAALTGFAITNNAARREGGGIWLFEGNLTLTSGEVSDNLVENVVAPSLPTSGGGISQQGGSLTLTDVIVSDNVAANSLAPGGGIFSEEATLMVSNSTLSGNRAGRGGGLFHQATRGGTGTVSFTDVTISNNTAVRGGGIYNSGGGPVLTRVTISDNAASLSSGGGIYNDSDREIGGHYTNVTFSGNTALLDGGALFNFRGDAEYVVENATMTGNSADRLGGAIRNRASPLQRTELHLSSSVVFGNTSGGDSSAAAQISNEAFSSTVASFSLLEGGLSTHITDGGGNVFTDPQLGPLTDNGGAVLTHLPGNQSPVIEAGVCSDAETDARGLPRLYDHPATNAADGCDIGAVELQEDEIDIEIIEVPDPGAFPGILEGAGGGTEIRLPGGTFTPVPGTGTPQTGTFRVPTGVRIVGGFTPPSAPGGALGRRTPGTPTLLSGDLDGDDRPFEPDVDSDGDPTTPSATDHIVGDNVYHVVTLPESASAFLDGIVITGGDASGAAFPETVGGGLFAETGSSPHLVRSSIVGNRAAADGGGLYAADALVSVTASTLAANTATRGGALFNEAGATTLASSTVTANAADEGGGLFNAAEGRLSVANTILFGNTAAQGTAAEAQLRNADPEQDTTAVAFSLVEGGLSPGTVDDGATLDADPLLGPYAANGGATFTFLPAPTSPVVDAGQCGEGATDQRGMPRPFDALAPNISDGCDIGAVELQEGEVPTDGEPEEVPVLDRPLVLEPARPNPFRGETTLRFAVREAAWVRAEVYDMQGRLVRVLFEGEAVPSRYEVLTFRAAELASGLYVVRVATAEGAHHAVQRVLLVR